MNEFLIAENRVLTPDQIVRGVMGISIEQLINEIRENRDGRYDCLFTREKDEITPPQGTKKPPPRWREH